MNSMRCQAIKLFKQYIKYKIKDKENCVSKEHKYAIKLYNCIHSIKHNHNVRKVYVLISNLYLSTSKFKNHYFKEVLSASFTTLFCMKCHNPYTYYLLASESNFILYKHTLCLL